MALRLMPVPEWTNDAVRRVITAHSNVFEDPPQIAVERGELGLEKVRATLPVSNAGVPKRHNSRSDAIAHNKLWFKPKQIAWRILFETKRGVTVAVDLHINRKKDTYHQLLYGPSIQRVFETFEMVRQSRRIKKQDFSAAILQIPALYFSALWLTANRSRELYVPLVSLPGRFKVGGFYTRSEIVKALVERWIDRKEARKGLRLRKAKLKRTQRFRSTQKQ